MNKAPPQRKGLLTSSFVNIDDKLNIPIGIPLVYELNDDVTPIRHFYLGDPALVKQAVQAVADQSKLP